MLGWLLYERSRDTLVNLTLIQMKAINKEYELEGDQVDTAWNPDEMNHLSFFLFFYCRS